MTLKDFIEENALKQKRVAEIADVSESQMSNYCRNLMPTDDVKMRIAAALTQCTGKDVTVEQLWPVAEKV